MELRDEENFKNRNKDPEEHMEEIIHMIADEQANVQEAKD